MNVFDFKLSVGDRGHYFDLFTTVKYSWALPLAVNVESYDRDYFEINIHVLCFYFMYTTTSKKWEQMDISGELVNNEPQEETKN